LVVPPFELTRKLAVFWELAAKLGGGCLGDGLAELVALDDELLPFFAAFVRFVLFIGLGVLLARFRPVGPNDSALNVVLYVAGRFFAPLYGALGLRDGGWRFLSAGREQGLEVKHNQEPQREQT